MWIFILQYHFSSDPSHSSLSIVEHCWPYFCNFLNFLFLEILCFEIRLLICIFSTSPLKFNLAFGIGCSCSPGTLALISLPYLCPWCRVFLKNSQILARRFRGHGSTFTTKSRVREPRISRPYQASAPTATTQNFASESTFVGGPIRRGKFGVTRTALVDYATPCLERGCQHRHCDWRYQHECQRNWWAIRPAGWWLIAGEARPRLGGEDVGSGAGETGASRIAKQSIKRGLRAKNPVAECAFFGWALHLQCGNAVTA